MLFFAENIYGSGLFATCYEALRVPDKPASVAKFLDVTPATLRNWLSGKVTPPRAAVIALWHESDYGRSVQVSHSNYELAILHGLESSLRQQNDYLKSRITQLEAEAQALRSALMDAQTALPVAANESSFEMFAQRSPSPAFAHINVTSRPRQRRYGAESGFA